MTDLTSLDLETTAEDIADEITGMLVSFGQRVPGRGEGYREIRDSIVSILDDNGVGNAYAEILRLRDPNRAMEAEYDKITAAENVLTWLLIEKLGCSDEGPYTPDDAQRHIVAALDQLKAAESEVLRLRALTTPGEGCEPGPPFGFDRYINGRLMAEGVMINRERTLSAAMAAAARIASHGRNGEVPVLIYRDTRETARANAATAERDAAEGLVAEAINELHCCDDIPLQTGLVEGIEALRKSREELIAAQYKTECNRDDWRERALKAEAERDAALARVAELGAGMHDLLSWFKDKPSPAEWRLEAGKYGADDAINQARSLLTKPTAGDQTALATLEQTDG